MQIPDSQIPKCARQLSPTERDDSIQKRQRAAEVLTMAGVYNGNENRILDTRSESTHTARQKELLNMYKFGVVEVDDRPHSQQVLSTRWVQKQLLDGSYNMRIVARGFEQVVSLDADVYAGAPKFTTL